MFHLPVASGQPVNGERRVTLAVVRREVDHDQVKLPGPVLPLQEHEVLRGGILRPGGARRQQLAMTSPNRAHRKRGQQVIVPRGDFRLRSLRRTRPRGTLICRRAPVNWPSSKNLKPVRPATTSAAARCSGHKSTDATRRSSWFFRKCAEAARRAGGSDSKRCEIAAG